MSFVSVAASTVGLGLKTFRMIQWKKNGGKGMPPLFEPELPNISQSTQARSADKTIFEESATQETDYTTPIIAGFLAAEVAQEITSTDFNGFSGGSGDGGGASGSW